MRTRSDRSDRSARRTRPILLALAATLLALAGALAPARAPVALAASDSLELTTAATYTLVPSHHLVRVAVDVTARNNKPNAVSGGIVTKYFYEVARIAVQTAATNIAATSDGVQVAATTSPASGYTLLEVRFRSALFYRQSALVRVTFDLPGGAPRSASEIRVGSAFATFVAWAFGDSGSVRVVIPAGFEAEASGSDATKTTSNGATIFRKAGVTDIGGWYLVVNADRKSALTNERIDLSGGEHVVIRAWPEDAAWKKQVTELLTTGLPELVKQTGLDWPVAADLTIFEVHTPLLEGYAGVFFQGEDRIEISEDLDDLTILHEASHAWFNSNLFDGRWINEGFADTYASKALNGLGKGGLTPNVVSPTDKAAVRLADWEHPGRITDDATEAREQYGYDASWTVIRSIVSEVGDEQMRHVLAAAQHGDIAYVGVGAPETVGSTGDWRRFLDLLDEVGRSATADDLFRRWVLTAAQADQLDVRAAARTAYAGLIKAGAEWRAPFYVRAPMSDWSFPTATTRIDEAMAVLARRDQIAASAARLGLTPPPDLRLAYQSARDSLDDAIHVADDESAALRALTTATAAVAAPRAPFVALGLIGKTPELDLTAARSAFSAGAADAAARAMAVTALIDGSVEIGRGRLLAGIAVFVIVVILLLVAVTLVVRRRRRNRRAMAFEAATAAAGAERLTIQGSAVRIAEGEVIVEGAAPPDPSSAPPDPGAARSDPPPDPGAAGSDPPPDPGAAPPYATLADQSGGPPAADRIVPESTPDDRGDAS